MGATICVLNEALESDIWQPVRVSRSSVSKNATGELIIVPLGILWCALSKSIYKPL